MADLISRLAARTVRSTGAEAATPGTVAARPRPRGVYEPAAPAGDPPGPGGRALGATAAVRREPGRPADRAGHTNGPGGGEEPTAGPGPADGDTAAAARSRAGRDRRPDVPWPAATTVAGPGVSDRGDGPRPSSPQRDAGAPEPTGRGAQDRRRPAPAGATARGDGPDHAGGASASVPRGPERIVAARVLPATGPRPAPPVNGPGRRGRDGSGDEAGTVSIHIGRLDVRANLEVVEEPRTAAQGRDHGGPTLEEYLRGGGAGVGR